MRHKVGRTDDIPDGEMRQFYADDTEVLIIHLNGHFYGLSARCSHAGAPLAEGSLQGDSLICPWHYSCFRITDGSVLRGPAEEPLSVYAVVVLEKDLFIQI